MHFFPAIVLSIAWGSGWDQLLRVITGLPASFLWSAPRIDPLYIGACNVRAPLGSFENAQHYKLINN